MRRFGGRTVKDVILLISSHLETVSTTFFDFTGLPKPERALEPEERLAIYVKERNAEKFDSSLEKSDEI